MPRLFTLLLAATITLTLGIGTAAAHQDDHANQVAQSEKEPSIAAQKLNDSLTMLYGVDGFTGGNVVVSNGPDGMLIIDDKLPTMTEKLIAALNNIGGMESLKFVLNTHWHFDHAGGNATLGENAIIVAHTNVRKRLSTEQRIDAFEMVLPPSPASALPVITYDDSVSIHFNGEELQLMHMPNSHTDTDTVIYFSGSNVLHTGDLFFNGIFPFVDMQNGGNVVNMTKNVAKMIEMFPADVTIVPGHGALATIADLKAFYQMLSETTGHVEGLIADGKTLDEIKAAGVPAKWEGWAWRIDAATWNSFIHASLAM